jgi:hypothetical protein
MIKKGKETLKILRAIQSGKKISVTEPFSAPWFSARVVKGHLPLLASSNMPLIKIEAMAINVKQLNILKMQAKSK